MFRPKNFLNRFPRVNSQLKADVFTADFSNSNIWIYRFFSASFSKSSTFHFLMSVWPSRTRQRDKRTDARNRIW